MKIIALLAFCSVFGAAHAEQIYEPPPRADAVMLVPSAREVEREEEAARNLDERRQKMIDECEQNHGSERDCVRETDVELRAENLQSGGRIIHLAPPR